MRRKQAMLSLWKTLPQQWLPRARPGRNPVGGSPTSLELDLHHPHQAWGQRAEPPAHKPPGLDSSYFNKSSLIFENNNIPWYAY